MKPLLNFNIVVILATIYCLFFLAHYTIEKYCSFITLLGQFFFHLELISNSKPFIGFALAFVLRKNVKIILSQQLSNIYYTIQFLHCIWCDNNLHSHCVICIYLSSYHKRCLPIPVYNRRHSVLKFCHNLKHNMCYTVSNSFYHSILPCIL